ncbi:hypothetical protein TTHERM_00218350 (macronuclear) [Tetrahymena thermophila SB210]|uniref:Uncharacterized protein n=1 Tax=Tetrahymena thermophila (strain SB210) TaxID=312017 RepID=I7MKT2_TETTS|nr:hypothetical protein TTHERM_00218350 [Tetrahymena thermophila SB210]EAS00262.2 hypothetical protein TTHERM_00218350 [Tetrahymena thermophila SB210]|eukprot:XP_001020507.2 hypothetical protein TTHERM_00218350 [Tetrahymena thermophila SB210]
MSEKAQFCHNALIDQIDQWQKSLEQDLQIMKQIKELVISNEDQPMTDRIWVNKNVTKVIEEIQNELQSYKNERIQSTKNKVEFLSIIKKYEFLQANFQQINKDIRSIYSYSQDYHKLKDEQTKQQLNNQYLSIKKNIQENERFNDQKYDNNLKNWKSEQLNQKYQFEQEDNFRQEEEEEEQRQLQGKQPQSNVSFLNDTFNSIQNRQISQQQIEDLKQKSLKQISTKSINQIQQPSKSILKERKMIDFAENIKSEWFGDLQKAYNLANQNAENLKNCSVKTCQTAKFAQKGTQNLSQAFSRSKTPKHKRSFSQNLNNLEKQSLINQKSQLNYSFRQKQEENASALYILKREVQRIKELVQEQINHYDGHTHNNIDEEIKKYKLENTLMKTQCQILKDENQELLVEFQKTKKILEDQIMLSKELQDKLIEQQSQRFYQQQSQDQYEFQNQKKSSDENKNGQFISQYTDQDKNTKSINNFINQQITDNLNEEMLSSWVKKRVQNSNGKYNLESISDY